MNKGFYSDLSNEEYHADRTHYSSSVLKKALKGAKYFHEAVVLGVLEEKMNEGALAFGNYLHIALLEPHLLEQECEIYMKRTRAGKDFNQFKLDNEGKTIITLSELETAESIMQNFNNLMVDIGEEKEIAASTLFKGGTAEESLFTEIDGLPIKVRFDYKILGKEKLIIRDLKTSSSTVNSVQEAKYICNRYGYFLSAALYCDALRTALPELGIREDIEIEFQLVFASKSDYNINVYKVGKETLEMGRQAYKSAIASILKWKKIGFKEGLREL
jgi:hypothetical protein